MVLSDFISDDKVFVPSHLIWKITIYQKKSVSNQTSLLYDYQ